MRTRHLRWFTILRRVTAASFLVALAGSGAEHGVMRGSLAASRWLGVVPMADPWAALEVSLASRSLPAELWLGAGVVLAIAALLGPVFCGWLCPVGWITDLNQALRDAVRRRLHVRAAGFRASSAFRVPILIACLAFALVASQPVFPWISPFHVVAWSIVFGASIVLAAVGGLLVVEWFVPRLFCRALCPLGALLGAVGRWARLRIRVDPRLAGATPCHQCTRHCPMGIPVMEAYSLAHRESVDDPRCTRCGSCVDACPGGVLRLGFRRPERGGSPPTPRSGATVTGTTAETACPVERPARSTIAAAEVAPGTGVPGTAAAGLGVERAPLER